MVEMRWTPEAEHWLRDIHDYVAADNPFLSDRHLQGDGHLLVNVS